MGWIVSQHTPIHQVTDIPVLIPPLPISTPMRTATKDVFPFDIPSWLSDLFPQPTSVESDFATGIHETTVSHVTSVGQHSLPTPHHTSPETSITVPQEPNATPVQLKTPTGPTITGQRFTGPTSTTRGPKVSAATAPTPPTLQPSGVFGPVSATQPPPPSAIGTVNTSVAQHSKTFLQNTGVAVSIFVTIGLVLVIFGSFLFPILRRRVKLVDPEPGRDSREVPPLASPAPSCDVDGRHMTGPFGENTEYRSQDVGSLIHASANDDVDIRSAFAETSSNETLGHAGLSVSRSDDYPSSYPASILPEYTHTQRSLLLPAYSDLSHLERSPSQETLRDTGGIIVSYDATGTQLGIATRRVLSSSWT